MPAVRQLVFSIEVESNQHGHFGQVLLGSDLLYTTPGFNTAVDAENAAEDHLTAAFDQLLNADD